MANLTISVENEVLKQARIRALKENTSVNAVLGGYLEAYARQDEKRRERKRVVEQLFKLAKKARAGNGGERWTREELYDR